MGEDYPEDGYQTVQETNHQRINLAEHMIGAMEDETVTIATLDGELQMDICGAAIDLSYIATVDAELLEEAMGQTNVGGVRSQLNDRATSCMMRSLCQAEPSEDDGVRSSVQDEEGDSIFDPVSKMGL